VLVRADLDARLNAGIEYELCEALIVLATLLVRLLRVLGCFKDAEECLDHMVPVGVLHIVRDIIDLPN
jgi:hypothetical protein